MFLKTKHLFLYLLLAAIMLLSSCSRLGWGVLLWTTEEEPPILSGTVLPVYIKSNIDKVWVVGVPNSSKKIEIPLSQFEFVGSKKKAQKWAEEFFIYASIYAENLQDRLPLRQDPDNSSKRVYILAIGEIIKVLDIAEGNPPISATGAPLPGDWYKVITRDGITGYCFSYRLKIFDNNDRSFQSSVTLRDSTPDPDLDMVFSRIWAPESYLQMVNSRRINIRELEKNYRFDPGQDTGIAKIILPNMEREFIYQSIIPDGERAWVFYGSDLQMHLRSNNTLAVQYIETTGGMRTLLFVSLTSDVEDLIHQENARRDVQFTTIYNQGPVFTSNNYGTISFSRNGDFTWTGYDLLVPHLISAETKGAGRILMDVFLSPSLAEHYTGAFTLRFSDISQNNIIHFMYIINNNGIQFEAVPEFAVEDITITRRASSPMVLYFYKDVLP